MIFCGGVSFKHRQEGNVKNTIIELWELVCWVFKKEGFFPVFEFFDYQKTRDLKFHR